MQNKTELHVHHWLPYHDSRKFGCHLTTNGRTEGKAESVGSLDADAGLEHRLQHSPYIEL